MQLIVGGVRNGAAEEDWRWDLNLGVAAIEREDHVALKERREGHGVWGERRERITQLWRSEQKRTTQFQRREDHEVLEEKREDHTVLGCSFLPHSLGSRRDCREEKGRKDSCWWAMRRCHMALD